MHPLFHSPIVRHTNNLWSYVPQPPAAGVVANVDEIYIQTPVWDVPALSYRLARVVQKSLKRQHITQMDQLKDGFYVNVRDEASGIAGKWKVQFVEDTSFKHEFWQYFPFTRSYPNLRIAHLRVSPSNMIDELFSSKRLNTFCMEKAVKMPNIQLPPFPANAGLFGDGFTQLASVYLRTIDPYFVFEEKVLGAFRYVIEPNGMLTLKPILGTPVETEENRIAATAFRDYIVNQYGRSKLDYVNAAYGFSIDQIIAQGLPLLPDHVFKINIGMCNVEMAHLEQLFDLLLDYNNTKATLPLAVQTNLAKAFPTETLLTAFLASLTGVASVRKLPSTVFNQVVDLLMPSAQERERAYTGRKIFGKAIVGWNTQGESGIFNPSRDLFEHMQVFGEMERTNDWGNYHELSTHITCKKNLYRKNTLDQGWHLGVLVPSPLSPTGEKRWYVNTVFVDDGQGNFNYGMEPACDNYQNDARALPFIKNYRSTAADNSQIDWMETFEADLNPYGPPSSINPQYSYHEEKKDFHERTLPLWVGYLLYAEKSGQQVHFQKAIDEYVHCLKSPGATPPEKLQMAHAAQSSASSATIQKFLRDEATLHRELPEFKIAQDISCLGHSLGGSLAEFAIYYYGPRKHRIPLPNYNYICYASRGPAIYTYQDEVFMNFGRQNAELLAALGQRWKVRLQLEYGDFIPESGQSHLGTTGWDPAKDNAWLELNTTVFRPLETAQALPINTISTHGRRTGMAIEGRDFTQTTIDVPLLQQFDHDWWMSEQLIDLFGYRILRSAKLVEFGRLTAAIVTRPFMIAALKIYNHLHPEIIPANEKFGVIFMRYKKPSS